MAAKPTDGRNRSTRQVTKSATRRGRGDEADGELDTPAPWQRQKWRATGLVENCPKLELPSIGHQYDGPAGADHAARPVGCLRAAAGGNLAPGGPRASAAVSR